MKFATVVLLGILLLGSSASLNAQVPGTSQVVIAYLNEPTPQPPGSPYLCLTYYTQVGDLDLKSLFAPDKNQKLVVDRKHAYFIWVSDYNVQTLHDPTDTTAPNGPKDPKNPFNYVGLITEGTGTIYYTQDPESRDFTRQDLDRTSWGKPVAKFVRKAGMFQSMDGGNSGTFLASSVLVSSTTFTFHGKAFNFKDLVPHGMTCFETAIGNYEAGTCVAIDGSQSTNHD
jgi:hypothetical protein